ncbi:MAG TPA: radical SAM protein [Bryobacteraceae bacterium]|nr:radical SAM protein [Bryobacteraceae bacterium]
MLGLLLHHFFPASLCCSRTAYRTLAKIDREIRSCCDSDAAIAVLERSKTDLLALLRARFGSPAAEALALKILNIFLARHHLHARSQWVRSRPIGLVVDPSNMCRLACPGCVHSARSQTLKVFDWRTGTLPEDRFAALLELYGPYAVGVYFCNYGEPLLNLHTPRLIRLAKSYLLATALSTSLSVRRFDPEAYVESGLDVMALSIDGATQGVYERFRRHGELEVVLDNLRELVKAKRRLGRRTPMLSWNFLAFEHNMHEIPLARRMARKLGVDQFRVVNPFDVRWDDPEMRPAVMKAGVRRLNWLAIAHAAENWNPFPRSVDAVAIERAFERPWPRGSAGEAPPGPGPTCHWLYKNMVMDATGRILPCCGAPRPDGRLVFAAFDSSGGDPFNSGKYRQARSLFSAAVPPSDGVPYCAQCEWDHATVNIGGPEIRHYFRAADPAFFDRRSLSLLSGW